MFIRITPKPKTSIDIAIERQFVDSVIGRKFENFIILEEYLKRIHGQSRVWYKAICKCGTEFEFRGDGLEKRKCCSMQCRYNKKYGSKHFNWQGVGDLSKEYFTGIRLDAIERNLPFEITMEDAWNRFEEQNGKCILSRVELVVGQSRRRKDENTASLDRIDNDRGYYPDNIQWVHKIVNRMRVDLDIDYFIKLCSLCLNPIKESYNTILDFTSNDYRWRGCGAISGQFYQRTKHSALNRNILFNLSIEDCWNLFLKQEGKCGISGQNLFFGTSKYTISDSTASLDRIDSSKGYTLDNCWWLHKHINKIKNNLSLADFYHWCKLINSKNLV